MKTFYIPVAIFIVLAIVLAIGLRGTSSDLPSPFIGKPAPEFSLPRLDDSQLQFSPHSMRGKVWLLNVWASWCKPCRAEFPVLLDFARTTSVPVIGFNYTDTIEDGNQLLEQLGNPYQLSVSDANGRVGMDYGVYGVPETFVIDRQGIVRMKFIGPVTKDLIRDQLLPLIQKLNQS